MRHIVCICRECGYTWSWDAPGQRGVVTTTADCPGCGSFVIIDEPRPVQVVELSCKADAPP